MFINEKDLRRIIKEELISALTIRVKYEQHRDPKTGLPLSTPKIKEQDEYLPAWLINHQPYLEGALRGVQQTQDKQDGQIIKLTDKLKEFEIGMKAMSGILMGLEGSIKAIAYTPIKQINIDRDSKLSKLEKQINEGGSEQEKQTAKDKWKGITGVDYESSN